MKDSCLNAEYMKIYTHRCTATLLYPMSTLWTDLMLSELLSLRIEAEDVRRLSYQNLPIRYTLTGRVTWWSHALPVSEAGGLSQLFPLEGSSLCFSTLHWPGSYYWHLHQLMWSHLSSYKPLCAFPGFWLGMRLTSGTDFPVLATCCKGSLCQLFSPQASSFDSLGDLAHVLEYLFFPHLSTKDSVFSNPDCTWGD